MDRLVLDLCVTISAVAAKVFTSVPKLRYRRILYDHFSHFEVTHFAKKLEI